MVASALVVQCGSLLMFVPSIDEFVRERCVLKTWLDLL
jgi:hypothetical protein